MKKALVVFLALAMVAGVFAAEPVANLSVTEFSGNASVSWGVDLDAKTTGFLNATEANFKVSIIDGGSKATTGEGVWGEIVVKADDGLDIENAAIANGTASVDTAKLHFDSAYVGIKSGDTQVGGFDLVTAVNYKNNKVAAVGTNYAQGIVAGYSAGIFAIDVDFRSDATSQYTNNYAVAAQIALTPADLSAKVGFAYDLTASSGKMGIFASADYKLTLGDKFYFKPQVAFAMEGTSAALTKKLGGALFLGWGAEEQDTNIYYIAKKVSDGFSVATLIDLDATDAIPLYVGLWDSATFVPNLTFGASLDVTKLSDFANTMIVIAEVKYAASADDISITPKAGIKLDTGFGLQAGVDLGGIISNTTFSVDYASGDLKASTPGLGKVNLKAKISL